VQLRVHVEVEVVCEHTIRRGLCEDVHVRDSEGAHEREVDNLDELGDDERGFRKLFLWNALAVCQVPGGADVELTAVLWKGVDIPFNQRIRKARPAFADLLRRAAPLVHELDATLGKMCLSKRPEPVAEEIDVATGDVEGVGRGPEAGLLALLTGKGQQVGGARGATQFFVRWALVHDLHSILQQTPNFGDVTVVTIEREGDEIKACRHIQF